jgi:peptidoglycan lytic transglycosylase
VLGRADHALALLCAMLPVGCSQHPPQARIHYELGAPYEIAGVWRYPQESYDLAETGLAIVETGAHPPLTADGETFSPNAIAAAHPTLQLPAIARVTNLETGRQMVLRINDRGPAYPGRILAVTPHVAGLLGFPASGVERVRLQVLPAESHATADSLPGAPGLAISAAPRVAVQVISFAAPAVSFHTADTLLPPAVAPATVLQLPETVRTVPPDPGQLWILLSTFHQRRYAEAQRAKLKKLPGRVVRAGTNEYPARYRARLGPFPTIAQADAALRQAIAAGLPDARIAVE